MPKVTFIIEEDWGQTTIVTDKTNGFLDETLEIVTRGLIGHTFSETLVRDYINLVDGEVYKIGE